MLPHRLLHSGAYRALPPNARSLLVEMASLYNGENNGNLYLSVDDAAARLGVVDVHAAIAAFTVLQKFGFIEITKNSFFSIKAGESSRARCWRLTWLPGPGRKRASFDFLGKLPALEPKERKRMERGFRALKSHNRSLCAGSFPVVDSPAEDPIEGVRRPATVGDSTGPDLVNGRKQGIYPTVESASHEHLPYQSELVVPLGGMSD